MGVFGSSAALIINTLGGLYLLAVLLRFLLQIAKADFYNPVSQAVVRATDPLVRILRKVIPGYHGIDFSTLILAIVIEAIAICVLIILYGRSMVVATQGMTNQDSVGFIGIQFTISLNHQVKP